MSGKLYGAICVAAACSLTGLRKSAEYRRSVTAAQEMSRLLEQLETEICRLAAPLPEAIAVLQTERFIRFSALCTVRLQQDEPYSASLVRALDKLTVPTELKTALRELFFSLSRGGEPERAFSVCRTETELYRAEAERLLAERGKLASSVGVCIGLMLGIALC